MQKRYIFFLLCLTAVIESFAQAGEGVGAVRLLACPAQSDSIQLRWAASDRQTWQLGNEYGYIVERYTLLRDGQPVEEREGLLLTTAPLKPQPVAEWQKYEDADKYVSIAAECIFGESSVPLASASMIALRYKEEQNKFSFALYAADQSPLAARLSGLALTDRTAQKNEKYLYTVRIAAPDSVKIDTAYTFTGLSEYSPLPKPLDLTARWTDRRVLLSWNILYLNHIYNSYIIEKSPDGITYAPVSENASVQAADAGINPERAYRTDSFPDNCAQWYYRIRGVNAFGETGPPSDSVVGNGRLPITEAPVITNKQVIDNKEVLLRWDYPERMNEYITGFNVYRSSKPEGIKAKIHSGDSPQERSFIDSNPDLTNYYVLSVYDDGGSEKFSSGLTYAELTDSIPPAAPAGLAGVIDSTGVVRLHWTANTDRDIYGYRLFRGNRPEYEFMPVSPSEITDTHFTDTVNIRTLTKNIYYRLKAVDLRGNQSSFGDLLALRRPDVILPVTPVIKETSAGKEGIGIVWYNSSSEDVVKHYIYRSSTGDGEMRQTAEIAAAVPAEKTSSYLDTSVDGGESYTYQVVAEDDSGLRSAFSAPVPVKAFGQQQANTLMLKAKVAGESVTLTWTVNTKNGIEKILIYKSEGENPLRLLTNTAGDSFTDTAIGFNKTLRYRIKAVYADGSVSDFSNEAKADI
jgi:fibronectin type 3 domain-containing protein